MSEPVQAPGNTGAQTAEQRLNELLMYSLSQDFMDQSNGSLEPGTASYYTSEMYEIMATLRTEREQHAREVERLREEIIGLRWFLHKTQGHNQYFFRCESSWCWPSGKQFYYPALDAARAVLKDRENKTRFEAEFATPPTEGTPAEVDILAQPSPYRYVPSVATGDTLDAEQPRCPVCGYTKEDSAMWLDHHLCKGKIPTHATQETKL